MISSKLTQPTNFSRSFFLSDFQISLHVTCHRLLKWQVAEFKRSLHSTVVANAVGLHESLGFWQWEYCIFTEPAASKWKALVKSSKTKSKNGVNFLEVGSEPVRPANLFAHDVLRKPHQEISCSFILFPLKPSTNQV